MNHNPLVSIITVCYNSEKYIQDTIESVLKETYDNIEYIIVDGNSTDQTINIIKDYEPKFKGKMNWISENDEGIYDAMNKGLSISNGEYILFLNSGDYFLDKNIITHMVSISKKYDLDFLYGDVDLGNGNIRKGNVRSEIDLIFRTICHQSIFAHRNCFFKNNFDISYKWLADYKWVINSFKDPTLNKKYIHKVISYFDPSNATGHDTYTLNMERLEERHAIGMESFRGLKNIIFKLNNYRLYLMYRYLF